MFSKLLSFSVCFLLILVVSKPTWAWGVWAHYRINKGALMALPPELGQFLYNHVDYITEESVVPDVRKHDLNDKAESIRHFIDVEGFRNERFSDFPKTKSEAISKYGKDTLEKYGILPWHIIDAMDMLTSAFKNKNKAEILFLAADLGHYVGDAHMPLHTSLNHDGQFTGQKGIHGFWEAQLPEIFGKNFNLYTQNANVVGNIADEVWAIIGESHMLADSMLNIEKKLRRDKPDEIMYVLDAKGAITKNKYGQPIHSAEYAKEYYELLNGMVEKQMKRAIKTTADFWYTAWVNAGKPDLSDLDPEAVTKRSKILYSKDIELWKSGKVTGFRTINEY